jgi:hypothetical protein
VELPKHVLQPQPHTQDFHSFRKRIDSLSNIHTCTTCMESYHGIPTHPSPNGHICTCFHRENNGHCFSKRNNMDPGDQPTVLSILTQVEEMLIAQVIPIFQVRHALGGQYKYSGHTISFPQQILHIANFLPHHLSKLDILVVKRHGGKGKCYDCYVKKYHVINAFLYKIQHEKYYNDVQIDQNVLASLPTMCTNVSTQLHYVSTKNLNSPTEEPNISLEHHDVFQDEQPMSSFAFRLPNTQTKLEKIRAFVNTTNNFSPNTIQWPTIGLSPINEYNTEGVFDMAFLVLFPTRDALPHQPCMRNIPLDTYALHLMRYHDYSFGSHPRFRYYLFNLIMRHRIQSTTTFFPNKAKIITHPPQFKNCMHISKNSLQTNSQNKSCTS